MFSESAMYVFENHYFQRNSDGELVEKTPEDVFSRVGAVYEEAACKIYGKEMGRHLASELFQLQSNQLFSFNSPVYYNVGVDSDPLVYACFVGDLRDSMNSIITETGRAAKIFQAGAGIGFNFGALRPKGASIRQGDGGRRSPGKYGSSGPLSFMEVFNKWGDIVKSGGKRRAAIMAMLYDWHPDLEKFISCKKSSEGQELFDNMNLSICVSDKFIRAVRNKEVWRYKWQDREWPPEDPKTTMAEEVFQKIVETAHASGDPGMFFIDTANQYNTTPISLGGINCTNPCFGGDQLIKVLDNDLVRFVSFKTWANEPGSKYKVWDGKEWVEACAFKSKENAKVVEVRLSEARKLVCTPDHLFMTPDGSCEAKNLTGRGLCTEDGGYAAVREVVELPERQDVYDFSMKKTHWASVGGVMAHNCGEVPLPPNTSCNLGSINLRRLYESCEQVDGDFMKSLSSTAAMACDVLDLNTEISRHPDEGFKENTLAARPVGIGIMGFGAYLMQRGIPYGSDESLDIAEKIMETITLSAYKTAVISKADAPESMGQRIEAYEADKEAILKVISGYKEKSKERSEEWEALLEQLEDDNNFLRNAYVTMIAPTGNTGLAFDAVTGGAEPDFALVYRRNTADGDTIYMANPVFRDYLKTSRGMDDESLEKVFDLIADNHGNIEGLKEFTTQEKKVFATAHTISPTKRLRVQAAFQRFTTMAISSTVNLPETATVEDVSRIYLQAYDLGLKGITVYRDNSRSESPISYSKNEGKTESLESMQLFEPYSGMDSKTYNAKLSHESDDLSVHVNTPYDEDGYVRGVFLNVGKSGSFEMASSEALGKLISYTLRLNQEDTDLLVIKALEDIDAGTRAWVRLEPGQDVVAIKSIPDFVAKILRTRRKARLGEQNKPLTEIPGAKVCSECGEKTYVLENGCWSCKTCGRGKC